MQDYEIHESEIKQIDKLQEELNQKNELISVLQAKLAEAQKSVPELSTDIPPIQVTVDDSVMQQLHSATAELEKMKVIP